MNSAPRSSRFQSAYGTALPAPVEISTPDADAKQTDKIALPISEDVQRSSIKESFVNQVRAIKKQIS